MDFWTDFGLLTDSFDLNLYLEKVCSLVGFDGGELRFCCEIWIKPRNRWFGLFQTTLKFFTRVEGGDRRPQSAEWRVGVSC